MLAWGEVIWTWGEVIVCGIHFCAGDRCEEHRLACFDEATGSEENARGWSELLSADFLPRVALCKKGASGGAPAAGGGRLEETAAEAAWIPDGARWREWTRTAYERVSRASALLNHPSLGFLLGDDGGGSRLREGYASSAGGEHGAEGRAHDTRWGVGIKRWEEIAVVVMNQPSANADRLRHMQALTRDVGWLHTSFPRTTKWSDLDMNLLIESGVVSPLLQTRFDEYQEGIDHKGQMVYVANAMDQVSQIRAAADKGSAIIVLEDDLLLSDSIAATREMMARVFDEVPHSADAVYLEFCFETCGQLRYKANEDITGAGRSLARAHAPSCSAAVLFTVKGARKVASLAWPIFDVIDRMYQHLVVSDLVEACKCVQSRAILHLLVTARQR